MVPFESLGTVSYSHERKLMDGQKKNSASAVSYRVDWARSKTLERRDKNRSNSLSVTENETTTLADVSKRRGSVCRRERDHYASQSVINLFGQTFAKHLATSYTLLLLSTSYTKYKISINTKEKQKEQQKNRKAKKT